MLLLCYWGLAAQSNYQYHPPKSLDDGWPVQDLRTLDIDTPRIYALFNQLKNHQLHSLLVVRDSQLLLEEYFGGYDQEKNQDLRSATKSMTGLLVGIAIDKGYIKSVDDPITDYLGDLAPKKNLDPRKQQITIRHLITMSTGLDCNDWDRRSKGQEDRIYKKRDWLQYFLDLPMINDPGQVCNYCTMGQVLAMELIARAAKQPIDAFAAQYLFDPLGIEAVVWGHTSKRKDILPAGKRLYMRPRDLAKIGRLVLQKGQWNGQTILSEAWIEQATSQQTLLRSTSYGFLWWNFSVMIGEYRYRASTAMGNGGQYLFVLPKENLVIVFTGGAYNSPKAQIPFAILREILLPTFAPKPGQPQGPTPTADD